LKIVINHEILLPQNGNLAYLEAILSSSTNRSPPHLVIREPGARDDFISASPI
jgi:hypothetical protein